MELVDFRWRRCRDGYRLVEGKGGSLYLAAESDRFDDYRPLEIPALFAKFAEDTPSSAKGMQDFCIHFGLPGGGRADLSPFEDTRRIVSTAVDELLRHQRTLRRALALFREADSSKLVKLWNSLDGLPLVRIAVRTTAQGQFEMVFVPPDLIQAMWLQFARVASSTGRLFRCERCNEPFVVGSRTGRRGTSKWCSNACKVAAFKDRKAQVGEGRN